MKRKPVEIYDTGVKQYTEFRMRPFCFSREDHNYALMLTEACAPYHLTDEHNAALILLIAGIVAIESADDRQVLASLCVERIFSHTRASRETLKKFMLDWEEEEFILGTI